MEQEVGRCFCSEECIRDYFQPIVDGYEQDYQNRRGSEDFKDTDRPRMEHYRALTLQDPDEIWVDASETGDRYFSFVSHFKDKNGHFSYVVVCLAIEGVPSFVFLHFPTRDEALVDLYRKGIDALSPSTQELLKQSDAEIEKVAEEIANDIVETPLEAALEGSASQSGNSDAGSSWPERMYLELRQSVDIPLTEQAKFAGFVEAAVEDSDEIWILRGDDNEQWMTFISRQSSPENYGDFVMVVVCETNARGEVVPIFSFATIDPGLVQYFRRGVNSLNKAFGVGWGGGQAA